MTAELQERFDQDTSCRFTHEFSLAMALAYLIFSVIIGTLAVLTRAITKNCNAGSKDLDLAYRWSISYVYRLQQTMYHQTANLNLFHKYNGSLRFFFIKLWQVIVVCEQ